MELKATLITTDALVEAARAAQAEAAFPCALSANGELPATHYASSGFISEEALAALADLAVIVTGVHSPHAAIAEAGLQVVTAPPSI